MKKVLSLLLSISLLATIFAVPTFAVSTYASAAEFISAAINSALGGIESDGLDAAVTAVNGYFTNAGDVVSYKGSVVGYWENSALYADAEHTQVLVQETEDSSYTWDPTFLDTVLGDVNNSIVEHYVPTTNDWTKIIGKYDINLGDATIPADQWIPMDIQSEDNWDNLTNVYNFTRETGISTEDLIGPSSGINIKAYVVD